MSSPQHEPTMEEILASIRKIISEDAPADAPVPGRRARACTSAGARCAGTDPGSDGSPGPPPAPAPDAAAASPHVHAGTGRHRIPERGAGPGRAGTASNDIFSDHTRQAMDNAFAAIPPRKNPHPRPRAPRPWRRWTAPASKTCSNAPCAKASIRCCRNISADNSAAVMDRMKPLIREWMDEHFPALLEGAVRAEVERVVKARGTKR